MSINIEEVNVDDIDISNLFPDKETEERMEELWKDILFMERVAKRKALREAESSK